MDACCYYFDEYKTSLKDLNTDFDISFLYANMGVKEPNADVIYSFYIYQ